MKFTVHVKADKLYKKLNLFAERAEDLERPLKIFGGYLRKKAIERYKAQNFAPLADSTLEKRALKGLKTMERKLHMDLHKAIRRANAGRPHRGIFERFLSGAPDLQVVESRGTRNRLSVLAEFQRRHRPQGSIAQRTDLKPLTLKQMSSLGARTDRAVSKAVGKSILGKLPKTLIVEVVRSSMRLVSQTHQKFSRVHNEGGTGGHGAPIPERKTIYFEEQDMEVLISILKDHLVSAFEE